MPKALAVFLLMNSDGGLARVVEERGYASLSEMHGCMNLARCHDPAAFERGNTMRILQSWRP